MASTSGAVTDKTPSKKKEPLEKSRAMIGSEYMDLLVERERLMKEVGKIDFKMGRLEAANPWLLQIKGHVREKTQERPPSAGGEPPKKKERISGAGSKAWQDAKRVILESTGRANSLKMKDQAIPWTLIEKMYKAKDQVPGFPPVFEADFWDNCGSMEKARPPEAQMWLEGLRLKTPE